MPPMINRAPAPRLIQAFGWRFSRLKIWLGILAAIASQALYVTERPAAPPLAGFLEQVRAVFPPLTGQRTLGDDVDRIAAAFSARVYPH